MIFPLGPWTKMEKGGGGGQKKREMSGMERQKGIESEKEVKKQ